MYNFSNISKERLATCDPRLQKIANEVIKKHDCAVLCGHRNEKDQNEAFASGRSKLKWPKGEHNKFPSNAMDLAPFVNGYISFDSNQCYFFAGIVLDTAFELDIKIRWGGDWDGDHNLKDQKFNDLVHFELI